MMARTGCVFTTVVGVLVCLRYFCVDRFTGLHEQDVVDVSENSLPQADSSGEESEPEVNKDDNLSPPQTMIANTGPPAVRAEFSSTPGVWRQEAGSNTWVSYSTELAELIFVAYSSGVESVEWFRMDSAMSRRNRESNQDREPSRVATNTVDFDLMQEVDLATGQTFNIKIMNAIITDINYGPIEIPVETGVWWKDGSGKWHCYDPQNVHKILDRQRKKSPHVTLKRIFTPKYPYGMKYVLNLTKLTQMNPETGHERPIRFVGSTRMPPEVGPVQGQILTNLVQGCLQRLMSPELIRESVNKSVLRPFRIHGITLNKHLQNEGQSVFIEFRLAYMEFVRRVPGCWGQLQRLATHVPDISDGSGGDRLRRSGGGTAPLLRHVLYLAIPTELEHILKYGLKLSPNLTEGFAVTTEYYNRVSKSAWKNAEYCLLVFLVLIPKTPELSMTRIPVSLATARLPVAVLTLRNVDQMRPGS